MNPETYREVKEIFLDVRRLPPQERSAFLDRACTSEEIRREAMLMQLEKSLKLQQTTKPDKKKRKRPRSNIEARKRGFVNDDKERQSVLKLPINMISALLYADS